MKILYIHGFGSRYDPEHEKIKTLETLGEVVGVDIDYTKGFLSVLQTVMDFVTDNDVDVIIGTSMGGYMAATVGSNTGLPFVALNPAIVPSETLKKWAGTHTDFTGREFYLTDATIANYPDIATTGAGLVIVETADEVLSAAETESMLSPFFHVERFKGGSHRFEHMEQAVPIIKSFLETTAANYGLS